MEKGITLENKAVERIFQERKDFIVIGLTGRTGCGCTTVAQLLCKNFEDLQPPIPSDNVSIDGREYSILYEYMKNAWVPFRLIEMKHVIFTFILEHDYDTTIKFINEIADKDLDFSAFKGTYTSLHEKRMKWKEETTKLDGEVPASDEIFEFYFHEIPRHYDEFQKIIPVDVYTKLLQTIGDNIRSSGDAFSDSIVPQNVLKLSQRVNMLIKILRKRNLKEKKQVLVVIDAFRNPYEATFFKDRYSAFYLFAVNATDDERKDRLMQKGFTYTSFVDLDKKEYPSLDNSINDFYRINIEKTIEIADIHINVDVK